MPGGALPGRNTGRLQEKAVEVVGVTGAPGSPRCLPFAAWGGLTPTICSFVPGQRAAWQPPQQLARALGLHEAGAREWPRARDRRFCCPQPPAEASADSVGPSGDGSREGITQGKESHQGDQAVSLSQDLPLLSKVVVGRGREGGRSRPRFQRGTDPLPQFIQLPLHSPGSVAQPQLGQPILEEERRG